MTKTATDKAKKEGIAKGMEKGEAIGIVKGIEIGRNPAEEESEKRLLEQKRESAKSMKLYGIPLEKIAEDTKLSIEEIREL